MTFGSGATTPGMPGMGGMPSMAGPPAGTSASTTGSAAPVAGDAVSIDNFAFVPATLTVPAGSTVTWTNHDEEPHTVAANDGSFHSPGMGSQGTYSHTFPTAGKFDYVCSIHPFMHATVVVTQ
jgi:plastocyanin